MLAAPLYGLCALFLTIDDCKAVWILFPDVALVWKVVLQDVMRVRGLGVGRLTDGLENDDNESPNFTGRRGH